MGNDNLGHLTVRIPKTAELVATHIRRQIVTGQLTEGDALPSESALMEEFNLSRPTLREAFRILESEGLITVRRGARGGARIQEPSSDVVARYAGLVLQHRGATVADVLEARVIVEAPAVGILAARRDHLSLSRVLQAQLDSLDPEEPVHFHEFNALVVELTDNQTLILLTAALEHISQAAAVRFNTNSEEDRKLAAKAHTARQRLIDLIEAGDPENAEAHWRKHLTAAGKVLAGGVGASVVDLFG